MAGTYILAVNLDPMSELVGPCEGCKEEIGTAHLRVGKTTVNVCQICADDIAAQLKLCKEALE